MTTTTIPFELNCKPGLLEIRYQPIRDIVEAGFDLLAGSGFDVDICVGYPTLRAAVRSYAGAGYATGCAWIQIVTRREFATVASIEPLAVVADVDTHPTLAELGVPFFAMGFPAEIYDAPCDNLGNLGRLEWLADTFLVILPGRANNYIISRVAGFSWGYREYNHEGQRRVEIEPLRITDAAQWAEHLHLLRSGYGKWHFSESV